ncbi:MAG: ABC transporter ATP-binding protein [Candidatus Methanomethylicaceae archaeon]
MSGENNVQEKIIIEDLSKTFKTKDKEICALENINLKISENEFTILLGPSGCGKTTLLNIIAGLEKPTKGRVLIDNNEIRGPGSDRAYVFQQFALFPWLTVYENVEYGLKIRGVSKEERFKIVMKFLKMMGLEEFKDAYPRQLSGGMQQRVAIARAYANNPKVLLMDEPFGALDAQTRAYMQEELINFWQREKLTVIFVTHSVEEAIFLGDKIVLFTRRPGKIKEIINVNEHLNVNKNERYSHEVKANQNFIRLREYIWNKLREEFLVY